MKKNYNMDPNLQIKNSIGCKQLLLRKLSFAVICSVISQIIILSVFLFFWNFNIFHPIEWLELTFSTLTSITTWLFVIPFLSIIFAQSIICAKDYVLQSTCSSSRIEKLLSAISPRNILLFFLHIFSGGLITWLYVSLSGETYGNLFVKCKIDHYCLNIDYFYLILCGLWTGLYFFVRIYTSEKKILFPVVQQMKLLQFKSRLISIIKTSQRAAIWPTLYFLVIYFLWGNILQDYVNSMLNIHKQNSTFLYTTILFSWFFSTLYIFTMNLMRFFFELFLTEPINFPILSFSNDDLTLSYALSVNNIPIIQHLACFDLFLFSRNSFEKRKLLYTLSQPGNHPHNWNNVITNVLKIISEYTEVLNTSVNAILNPEPSKKVEIPQVPVMPIQSPVLKNFSFNNIRNSSLQNIDVPLDVITVTQNKNFPFSISANSHLKKITEKIYMFTAIVRTRFGFNYLFGHLPLKNIQCCLENGQVIIWATQGLSNLTIASLKEDNFGVVQKDLPVILSALVDLKQSVEKLNRIPAFTRKIQSADDFNIKMKASITSAVKHSLYNICKCFGPFISDIPLKKEVLQYLQYYLPEK